MSSLVFRPVSFGQKDSYLAWNVGKVMGVNVTSMLGTISSFQAYEIHEMLLAETAAALTVICRGWSCLSVAIQEDNHA